MLFVEPDVDCFRIDVRRVSLPTDVLALTPQPAHDPVASATRIIPEKSGSQRRGDGNFPGWQPGRAIPALALLGAHQKPHLLLTDRSESQAGGAEEAGRGTTTRTHSTGHQKESSQKKKHAYEHITVDERADALHRALLSTLYARFPYELKDTIENVYVFVITHMAPPSFSAQPLTVEEIAELTTYHQFLPAELRYRTHPSHLGPLLDPVVEDTPIACTASHHTSGERAEEPEAPDISRPTATPFQLPKFFDTFFLMAQDLSPTQKASYRRVKGDLRIARRGLGPSCGGVGLPSEDTADHVMSDMSEKTGVSPQNQNRDDDDDDDDAVADGMTGFTVMDGHFTHYVLSTADEDEQRAAEGHRRVDGEGLTTSLDELAERQWEHEQAKTKRKVKRVDPVEAGDGVAGVTNEQQQPTLSDRQRRMSEKEAARAVHFSVYRLPLNLFSTDDQRFYAREREELRFRQCHNTESNSLTAAKEEETNKGNKDAGWLASLSRQREAAQSSAMKDLFTSEMPTRHRAERDEEQRRFFKHCHDVLTNMVVSRLAPPAPVSADPSETTTAAAAATESGVASKPTPMTMPARECANELSQLDEQKKETTEEEIIVIPLMESTDTATAPTTARSSHRSSAAASSARPTTGPAPAHDRPLVVNEEGDGAAAAKPKRQRGGPPASLLRRLQSKTATPASGQVVNEEEKAAGTAKRALAGQKNDAVVVIDEAAGKPKPTKKPKGPPAALLARLNKKTAAASSPEAHASECLPTTAGANNAATNPQETLNAITEAAHRSCVEEDAAAAQHAAQAAPHDSPSPTAATAPASSTPNIPQRIPGVSCDGVSRLLYSLVPCDCYHMVMDDVNPLYYAKSSRATYAPHTVTLGLVSDLSLVITQQQQQAEATAGTATCSTPTTTTGRASSGVAADRRTRGSGGENSRLAVRVSAGSEKLHHKVYAPSRMSGLLSEGARGERGLQPGKLYYFTEDGLVSSKQASRAASPDGSHILRGGSGEVENQDEKKPRTSTLSSARPSQTRGTRGKGVSLAPTRFNALSSATDGFVLVTVSLTCNDISGNPKHTPESLRMKGARLPEYLAGTGGNEQASSAARNRSGSASAAGDGSAAPWPVVDLFKALASSSLAQHKLRFGAIRPVVSIAVLDGTSVLDGSFFTEKQHAMARGELFGDGVGGHGSTPASSQHAPLKSQQSKDFTCRGLIDHTWLSVPVQRNPYCQEAVQWMPVVLGSTDCISDVGYRTAVHLGFFVSDERRRRHEEAAKDKADAQAREAAGGVGAFGNAASSLSCEMRTGRVGADTRFGVLPTRAEAISSLTPSVPLPRGSSLWPLASQTANGGADTTTMGTSATNVAHGTGLSRSFLGERNVNASAPSDSSRTRKGGVAFTFGAGPGDMDSAPSRPQDAAAQQNVEVEPITWSTRTTASEKDGGAGAFQFSEKNTAVANPRAATGGLAFDLNADAPVTPPGRRGTARPTTAILKTSRAGRGTSAFDTTFTKPARVSLATPVRQTSKNLWDDVPVGGRQRAQQQPANVWDDVPVGGRQRAQQQPANVWDDVPVGGRQRAQQQPANVWDDVPVGGRQRTQQQPANVWDDVPVGGRQRTQQQPANVWDDVPVGGRSASVLASNASDDWLSRDRQRYSHTPPPSQQHQPPRLLYSPNGQSRAETQPAAFSSSSQTFRNLQFGHNGTHNGFTTAQSAAFNNPFSQEAARLSGLRRSTDAPGSFFTSPPGRGGGSPHTVTRPTMNGFGGGDRSGFANNNNNNSASWLALGGTGNNFTTAQNSRSQAYARGSPPPRGTAFGTHDGYGDARFSHGAASIPQDFAGGGVGGGGRRTPPPQSFSTYGAYDASAGRRFMDGDTALVSPISPLSPSESRLRGGGGLETAERHTPPPSRSSFRVGPSWGAPTTTTARPPSSSSASAHRQSFTAYTGAGTSLPWSARDTIGLTTNAARRRTGRDSARGTSQFNSPSFAINEYDDVLRRPGSRVRGRGVTAMDDVWSRPVPELTTAPALRRARLSESVSTTQSMRGSLSHYDTVWPTTQTLDVTSGRSRPSSVLGRPPLASSRPPLYPAARTAAGGLRASRVAASSVRERFAARKAAQEREQHLRDYDDGLRDNYMVGNDRKRVRFDVPVTIAAPTHGTSTRTRASLASCESEHNMWFASPTASSVSMPSASRTAGPAVNWEAYMSPAQTALEVEAQARSLGAKMASECSGGGGGDDGHGGAGVGTVRDMAKAAEDAILSERKTLHYQEEAKKLQYMADLVDDSCDGVNVSFTLRDIANAFLLMPCGHTREEDICEAVWASEGVSYFLSRKSKRLSGGWESYMARLNVYQEPFYLRDQAFIFVLRVPHHPQLRVCVAMHNINDLLALLHESPLASILPTQEEAWLQELRYSNSEYDRYWYDNSSDEEEEQSTAYTGTRQGRSSRTGWRPKSGESVVIETRWFFGLFKTTKRIRTVKDTRASGRDDDGDGGGVGAARRGASDPLRTADSQAEEDDARKRRRRHRQMRRQFYAEGLKVTWRHRLALWWSQLRAAWRCQTSTLWASPLLTDPACFKSRAAFLSDRIAAYAAVQHRINTLKAIREAYVARRAEELVRQRTLRICDRTHAQVNSGVALGGGGVGDSRRRDETFTRFTNSAPATVSRGGLQDEPHGESERMRTASQTRRRPAGGVAMTYDVSGQLQSATTTRTATAEGGAGGETAVAGRPSRTDGSRGGGGGHAGGPPASLLRRLASKQPLSTSRSASASAFAASTPPRSRMQSTVTHASRAGGRGFSTTSTGTTGMAGESALERRKRIMAAARQSAHTGQKASLASVTQSHAATPGSDLQPHVPFSTSSASSSYGGVRMAQEGLSRSTIDHYAASGSLQRGGGGRGGALVERGMAGLDLVLHVQRSDELAKALERVAARRENALMAPLMTALRVVPRSEQLVRGTGGGVIKSDAEGLLYAGFIPTPLEIHRLLEAYNITVRQLQQLLQWQWEHHQHSYELVPLPIFRDAIVPAVDEYFSFLGQQRERLTGQQRSGHRRRSTGFENPFIDSSPHWQNASPLGISPLARVLLLFASRWSWLVPINYEASRRQERLFFLERDIQQALSWQLSSWRVFLYLCGLVWMTQYPGTALFLALLLVSVYGMVSVVGSACGWQNRQRRPAEQRVTHPLHANENAMPLIDHRTSLLYRQSEGAAAAMLEQQHDFPYQAMVTRVLQVQAFLSSVWSRLVLGCQGYSPMLWLCVVALCVVHLGLYLCYQRVMNWVVYVNGGWCQTAATVSKDAWHTMLLPLLGLESNVDTALLDALEHVRDVLAGHAEAIQPRRWWQRHAAHFSSSSSSSTSTKPTVAAYSQEGVDGKAHAYYQNGAYYTYGGRNEPLQGHDAYAKYGRGGPGAATSGGGGGRGTESATAGKASAATASAKVTGERATAPALASAWNMFASTVASAYGHKVAEQAPTAARNVTLFAPTTHAAPPTGGHAFIPFLFFVYLVTWWLPRSPVRALWRRTWSVLTHDDSLARRPLLSF